MQEKPKYMVVVCGQNHFSLVPHELRPGQAPYDILPQYRECWVPLEYGHSIIPNDVSWYPQCFVRIEPVDLSAVRDENTKRKLERQATRVTSEIAAHRAALEMRLPRRERGSV